MNMLPPKFRRSGSGYAGMSVQPPDANSAHQPLTHEARRYCHGDAAWTDWQPCTAAQAERYKQDDTFQIRKRLQS